MSQIATTQIEEPFDPSMLKAEVKNTTVGELCSMLENNLIDLQPDFQRHGDLWNSTKKSQLIESLILGLPLPSFYFYIDRDNKKWVVIDGLQRLCALQDFFVDKTLHLRGLQFLTESHNNMSLDDFSYFDRLEMSMRSVTLNILSGESSSEAKYIIFQRINSSGTQLQPAEIRNALFHGQSMEFAKQLANCKEFHEATNGNVSTRRLKSLDYVLRFIAFYLLGYENYADDKMNAFIGNALKLMNKTYNQIDYDNLRGVFKKSLSLCSELLGTRAFCKPLSEQEKKNTDIKSNPIAISLFEATMYSVAKLNEKQIEVLMNNQSLLIYNYDAVFQDSHLQKSLSNGTNKYKSVNARFTAMERVFNSTISSIRI